MPRQGARRDRNRAAVLAVLREQPHEWFTASELLLRVQAGYAITYPRVRESLAALERLGLVQIQFARFQSHRKMWHWRVTTEGVRRDAPAG